MSAIVGYVDFGSEVRPEAACNAMLLALRDLGSNSSDYRSAGPVCMGRVLQHSLPEDVYDLQPLVGDGGHLLFVTEGRIDNRDEVGAALALGRDALARSSDSLLLLRSWERWGINTFDRVLGDVAFAVWDATKQSLTLARSPLSTRSLFHHRGKNFLAFASTPSALLALPNVPRAPNLEYCALMLSGRQHFGAPATIFRDIWAVPPGHAVQSAAGVRTFSLWEPRMVPVPRALDEYAEAMRAELERSVRAQLRRHSGSVASHLSSGRDSSAVATTAAIALAESGDELIALTGAPPNGFQQKMPLGIAVDETILATKTAAAHPNIRHFVCRPVHIDLEELLEQQHRYHFGPMLTLSNAPWWTDISSLAVENGASVMLSGALGNFSISAGGQNALMELWRNKDFKSFWGGAMRSGGNTVAGWRDVATVTLGALTPRWIYAALRRAAGRAPRQFFDLSTLRQPWRRLDEQLRRDGFADARPTSHYRRQLRDLLIRVDNADRATSGCWGLDARDPTSDRRLVELCYSMPAHGFYSGASDRPAYELAFRDRIPRAVLDNRIRAYQQADWYEIFHPESVRNAFRRYGRNRLVQEVVDFQEVETMIDRWPRDANWMANSKRMIAVSDQYRNTLLGTLSFSSFIDLHFPDN